jgi:ElaB/YqjD/DUF883 family membrane-anchored ribosome-binding protein
MEWKMSETFDSAAKRAGKSINDAGSTAAGMMDDAIPAFGAAAHATADALRSAGGRASARLSELGDAMPDARDRLAGRVQDQPLMAVLLAAGVGLLTGLLWTRR